MEIRVLLKDLSKISIYIKIININNRTGYLASLKLTEKLKSSCILETARNFKHVYISFTNQKFCVYFAATIRPKIPFPLGFLASRIAPNQLVYYFDQTSHFVCKQKEGSLATLDNNILFCGEQPQTKMSCRLIMVVKF